MAFYAYLRLQSPIAIGPQQFADPAALPRIAYLTAIWNAIDFNEAESQFVNAVSLNASS
ncbi:hypothetical protein L227DRAFT_608796 [Lentinus tigrinus ALCF2SS1-6]|uniref:Uncharacterized protein n=1 Tax=Lentinus tigrinus ALCF2SS1-6 TaxID=1328759 RepID=A0A5C2SIC7_9APHY|nr:hypothetical protein L227DRAFT_608796 [Lentinus tigrinus ALCF2SS1-6]